MLVVSTGATLSCCSNTLSPRPPVDAGISFDFDISSYQCSDFRASVSSTVLNLLDPIAHSRFVFFLFSQQQDDDEMLVPHSDFAPVEGPQPMEGIASIFKKKKKKFICRISQSLFCMVQFQLKLVYLFVCINWGSI